VGWPVRADSDWLLAVSTRDDGQAGKRPSHNRPRHIQHLGGKIMAKAKKKATKKRKTTKELQKDLISNMETWKKIENASIASTGRVIEKTENPIVRLVMEIIQRDSQMHYRVQDWIAQSLQKSVALTPEDVGQVWSLIEDHIKIEKKTQKMAEEALGSTKTSKAMLVQTYLLEYLLEDEKKHNLLLERLAGIQKGMYPYG
jgi:hypothetical protein